MRFANRITNAILPTFLQAGTPTAELRKWHGNIVANYDFRTGPLKNWSIGGAARYQDRGVIDFPYFTVAGLRVPDIAHAYYAPALVNYDGWLRYKRKLGQRIDWSLQLNVRNVGVGNELIPIAAQPDGSIARWVIREPQKWTVTNSFSF